MNYLSLVISVLGLVLSTFVFYRTLIKEKQDLEIDVFCTFAAAINDQQFLILKFVAINRSKLPIVITDSVLKLNVPSCIDQKLSYPEFHGAYEKLEIFNFETRTNGQAAKDESAFSTPLPINVDPLKSISATIAISTPEYYTELNSGHKPSLSFETSGTPVVVSREKLLKSVMSKDQVLKGSYLGR